VRSTPPSEYARAGRDTATGRPGHDCGPAGIRPRAARDATPGRSGSTGCRGTARDEPRAGPDTSSAATATPSATLTRAAGPWPAGGAQRRRADAPSDGVCAPWPVYLCTRDPGCGSRTGTRVRPDPLTKPRCAAGRSTHSDPDGPAPTPPAVGGVVPLLCRGLVHAVRRARHRAAAGPHRDAMPGVDRRSRRRRKQAQPGRGVSVTRIADPCGGGANAGPDPAGPAPWGLRACSMASSRPRGVEAWPRPLLQQHPPPA
jgi:hypothetical protein